MLDDMTTSTFLLGNLVHKAINLQMDQLSRGRPVQGPNNAIKFISRRIGEIEKEPEKYLIEAMNGLQIVGLKEKGMEAERQVRIFFDEFFDFYKDLEIIAHDEEYKSIVLDGHKFWIMPDLITKSDDDRIFITDWKTDSNYPLDEHQMKMYIMWALKEKWSTLDNIRAEVVYLDKGKSKEYETTMGDIEKFEKELISNSIQLFDIINSKSSKDDFDKHEDDEKCNYCGYKSYCQQDNN